MECGFVNRVYPPDELEVETRAYALRVAENSPNLVRVSKLALNKAWDLQATVTAWRERSPTSCSAHSSPGASARSRVSGPSRTSTSRCAACGGSGPA